ncbi:MAG TPA: hypothetical protein PKH32_00910 [Verrucomicrobiota bacterium]|nr:hypothetical protein [Verrucomicrobiota bacterium]
MILSAVAPLSVTSPTTCPDDCAPGACQLCCSLQVVDELLATPGAVTGEEVDLLLDFRHLLRQRTDAEAMLRLFCELRRRLEQGHYLAFYRLRRWLENHVVAELANTAGEVVARVRLRLDFYCLEPIRRACLCGALQVASSSAASRLRFAFVPAHRATGRPLAAFRCEG